MRTQNWKAAYKAVDTVIAHIEQQRIAKATAAREAAARKVALAAERKALASQKMAAELAVVISKDMIAIAGDSFVMGDENRGTAHSVTVPSFKIGKYEITFEQWEPASVQERVNAVRMMRTGRGPRPVMNAS
ncbi:SUMF1/EgtB/PvdO family nonheme iron enzyme [Zhongshania sp.]|uniref:SUMF1/EgtB/PvdO family nonheme iron enzyme n=1 Tax=Zhongshania sp. TaxID=1971902 RepID=UPI003565F8E4